MPRYPIVVIKENERIIAGNMITKSLGEYGAVLKAQSDSNLDFVFLDDVFDNFNSGSSSITLKSGRRDNISHNLEKRMRHIIYIKVWMVGIEIMFIII